MKTELLKLIDSTAATALSSKVKSNTELLIYVSSAQGSNLSEKIYNAAYSPEVVCEHGNNKKFISFTKGYGYCGKAGTCKCAATFMSNRMKELKPITCQKNIDLANKRKEISQITTFAELKEYIVNNANGYEKAIRASNPGILNAVNNYSDAPTSPARYWHFINQIKSIPICNCKKPLRFINVIDGYAPSCKTCYDKTRAEQSITSITIATQSKTAPKCKADDCNNVVSARKNGIWKQYCSTKCKGKSNSINGQEKARATFKEKYGVEHALQNPSILQKMFATNELKHGVPIVSQKKEIYEKSQATKLEKYGYTSQWQDPIRYQQHVDRVAINLGYTAGQFSNVMQIPEIFQKAQENQYTNKEYTLPSGKTVIIQGYESVVLDLLLKVYNENLLTFKTAYQYDIEGKTDELYMYFPDFEIFNVVIEVKSQYTLITDLNKNLSKFSGVVTNGKDLTVFVTNKDGSYNSILPYNYYTELFYSELVKLNINCKKLSLVGNYNYDLLIEDRKLLIKYVDPRFMSEEFTGRNYLMTLQNEANVLGYTILFFDVFSLKEKFYQILEFVKYKCNISAFKVYARQCTVKLAPNNEARDLYDKMHLQGFTTASYHVGLYYNNTLVSCMSFSKYRPGIGKNRGDNAYELSRFATLGNVVGAASKLLSHFKTVYRPKLIYSFSDNMYSTGEIYRTLGFIQENAIVKPSYKYSEMFNTELYHRFTFSKSKLTVFDNYDESKSESQIMKEAGYLRLYDAGKKTWILQ